MSLQNVITYEQKLNQLRLDIHHPNNKGKVYVFLEGESDVLLFRKLFHDNCKVEKIPGGKPKVEECVQTLIAKSAFILGIIDADFFHLAAIPYNVTNVFLTDYHDMEMMLYSQDELFSALAHEHINLSNKQHSEIRAIILSSIEQISYLKWLNQIENLEYNFDIGFADLLSFVKPGVDLNQYFSRLLSKSPNAKITDLTDISERIRLLQRTNPDLFQLCNGHDFLTAFSEYLRKAHNVSNVNERNIASSCRIAYSTNHYQTTSLYHNTKKWADDNNCVLY